MALSPLAGSALCAPQNALPHFGGAGRKSLTGTQLPRKNTRCCDTCDAAETAATTNDRGLGTAAEFGVRRHVDFEKCTMARLALVVLVSMAVGCSGDPKNAAATKAAAASRDAPAPRQKWQEKFGMPTEIEPAKLTFAVAATREKFLKADRAARKIAGADWARKPGDTYSYHGWNGGTGGYRQEYAATWALARAPAAGVGRIRPNHKIVLSTELYDEPRQAYGFCLLATWEPKDGWRASLNFYSSDGPLAFVESFSLTFSHAELLPELPAATARSALVLGPGAVQFRTARSDDRYRYQVAVSSSPPGAPGPFHRPQADLIKSYWSSAASFQREVMEELERLRENARREIASGEAFMVKTKGGPTGRDVPMPAPSDRIPEAIKAAVLEEALAEIETRRKLVQSHYKAMHAAAVAAFPELPEVVTPK